MPFYAVTITATLRKDVCVEAATELEATELAHQVFQLDYTGQEDGGDEHYEQDTNRVREISEDEYNR